MVLFLKMSGLSFAYTDGEDDEKLSPMRKKNTVKHLPDLLSYCGYVFYFPGFLAGIQYKMFFFFFFFFFWFLFVLFYFV